MIDIKHEYPYNLMTAVIKQKFDRDATLIDIQSIYVKRFLDIVEGREMYSLAIKYRDVLLDYYKKHTILSEIAKRYSLSTERIRQIRNKAIRLISLRSDLWWIPEIEYQRDTAKKQTTQLLKIVQQQGKTLDTLKIVHNHLSTDDIQSIGIGEVGFSVRTYNCLKRAGINYITELVNYTPDEISKIRNMGMKSFNEVVDTMKNFGLCLKEDKHEDS